MSNIQMLLLCGVAGIVMGTELQANSFTYFKGPVEGPAKQVVLESSGEHGHGGEHDKHVTIDFVAEPKYEFGYGVVDPKHGDTHTHKESHDGHRVIGEYSLHEPGGNVRTVKYVSDKNGFQAQVHNSGSNDHGAPQQHNLYQQAGEY